ncbi:efflux RND transporter periplasmic adaptor subunit [Termitidicoccus mucosus]|uniref:Efflux transporter periplasmic adaptor subunit n=1 Tax=Termitidicoccus mucosus TaxID=1184151 RepID=A0A178IFQ0_9BACT|nr:efflux transporter periplasmic adaptor subunit [Opitutaceae bacterium TSB47]
MSRLKVSLLAIGGFLGIIALVVVIKGVQINHLVNMPQDEPVTTVTAAPVLNDSWQSHLAAIGSLAPVEGVTVAAELGGKITRIAFDAGSTVKAGDVLVQLDTATEEAQLRAAEAAVELAKINLDRSRELLAKSTISKAEFDTNDAQFKQASAQADNIRAVIAKKTIRAPFAGRLGIRLVNLGQILNPGDAIVPLQSLDPIFVDFSLPQQRLGQVAAAQPVRVVTDADAGAVFEGKITAINPEVDAATRNVRVQATLRNPDEQLRPGMFVNVTVLLPHTSKVVAVPATAVLYAPYGDSVFIIEDKKDEKTGEAVKGSDGKPVQILRKEVVRLGEQRGDFIAVTSGLKGGETVVTSGVFKLRDKIPVVVDNKLAPIAQLAPKPNDT